MNKFYNDNLSKTYWFRMYIGGLLLFVFVCALLIITHNFLIWITLYLFGASGALWYGFYRTCSKKVYVSSENEIFIPGKFRRESFSKNSYYFDLSDIITFEFDINNIKKIDVVDFSKIKHTEDNKSEYKISISKVYSKKNVVRVEFKMPLSYVQSTMLMANGRHYREFLAFKGKHPPKLNEIYFSVSKPEIFVDEMTQLMKNKF